MGYNWKKIFKSKTDKELFEISIGNKLLNEQAEKYAEKELKLRGFDFEKIDKYKKKWELERIYEEEREESRSFFNRKITSREYLLFAVLGPVLTLISLLNLIFDFIDFSGNDNSEYGKYFMVLLGVFFTVVGFIGYKNRRKVEIQRKEKVESLLKEL